MRRKFSGNEDRCPECGHLISQNTWNCSFCGWSLQDSHMHDPEIDSWDDYSDINNIPGIDSDFDDLFDYS